MGKTRRLGVASKRSKSKRRNATNIMADDTKQQSQPSSSSMMITSSTSASSFGLTPFPPSTASPSSSSMTGDGQASTGRQQRIAAIAEKNALKNRMKDLKNERRKLKKPFRPPNIK